MIDFEKEGVARPDQGGQRITEEWLSSLTDQACRYHFRFTFPELQDLVSALEIPDPLITSTRSRFTALEAFCLLCARFRTAGDMYELTAKYDRAQSAISEVVNELVCFLDETWEHLLDCDSGFLLHPTRLETYADAIHARGAPIRTVFGFIDCTIRRICRPSQWQRQAYNGHKKFHALKFQAIMLPNGLFGHLYGGVEGHRNDNALLTDSGIMERLSHFAVPDDLDDDTPEELRTFQIFGDPAYGLGPHMISPFSGAGQRTDEEQAWNSRMSAVRIEVEHGFGIVQKLWPFLNAGWKMRLYASPVGRYYRVGVFLANCSNCLRPNQVSQYFSCPPPSLEDYLHCNM
ncbi:hypothetical protein K435DRAFT_906381 [Dendrothele bispora CBS 962.96]|uniref:DDE Tnp4 domain-containing protein n=1 Tax=Dendrothele bispora (strain CBS 962.96) TaxID=1314807 RepID=A0A4S8LSA3_DENBC|nr:hypothetical protein K435DRAFT_906381 [Dendrothele bispora CBS 962.96]